MRTDLVSQNIMNDIVLLGKIEQGELKLNDLYLSFQLQKMGDCKVRVRIDKVMNTRSLKQNSYLWGGIYPLFAETTGHTISEIHEIFKRKFLSPTFTTYRDREIKLPRSTKKLTKGEFADYILRIEAEAGELGIVISSPDEWIKNNL